MPLRKMGKRVLKAGIVAGAILSLATPVSREGPVFPSDSSNVPFSRTISGNKIDFSRLPKGISGRQEGWLVSFDVNKQMIPRDNTLYFRLRNKVEKNNTLDERLKAPSRVSVSRDFSNLSADTSHENMLVVGKSTGRSKVKIHLLSRDPYPKIIEVGFKNKNSLSEKHFFSTEFQPNGTWYSYNGINVYSHLSVDKNKIRDFAQEVAVLQPLAFPYKANTAYFTRPLFAFSPVYTGFVSDNLFPRKLPGSGVILGHTGIFSDNLQRFGACHETAHAIFFSKQAAYNFDDPISKVFNDIPTVKNPEAHPVFSIFDESGYLKIDPKRGHPYDDPSELFASGFTVMRHFPAEFIEKMQSLKKKDVRSYALALKAAASILEYAGKRHPQVIHSTLIDFLQTELRTRK